MGFRAFRLLALVAFSSSLVLAQGKPSADENLAKQAYVFEHSSLRASFDANGTGVKEWSAQIKVLADAGVQKLAVLNFTYASANETVEFDYVRVRKPDGSVVSTPEYNFQDMPADVTRTAPMYSDIHEKHVAVKGLGVGDTLEYRLRYRTTKPEVPNHFWLDYSFNNSAMIQDETVEISFPASKTVKVFSPGYTPTVTEEAGRKIYRWQHTNLRTSDAKDDSDEADEIAPSIELSTFGSWEEIGTWYAALQKDEVQPTAEVKAKAAELTKGLTSDEEKIRAIYNFVSLQVHYVGLNFGIGRLQPHAAQDVLENQYGDCKDKHTLLAALLNASGYEAWPVLINASRKLRRDVPSVAQFNHVITVVPIGNKRIWLDTTPEVAPFGLLMPALRDKDALVIANGKAPELARTPADPPFPEEQVFEASGKLSKDDVFTGHMDSHFRGDSEVILRSAYRSVPEAKWKDLAQRISAMMGFAGEVSNVVISSPTDTSQPFHVAYDYVRKEYGDWDNRQITPPLPPVGIEALAFDTTSRKNPYKFHERAEIEYSAKIELPSGATMHPSPGTELVEAFAEYHASSRFADGVLTTKRHFVIKQREVAVKDWESLRKFAKAIADDENTFIRVGGLDGETENASKGEATPINLRFQQGVEALQQRDGVRAQELFQQVLASDAKYPGAHFNLAAAYQLQGRIEDALLNYHKEEEIVAEDERPYEAAAQLESFLGRRDEAIGDWRRLIKADPKNHEAPLHLSDLLIREEKTQDAVQVLKAALDLSPESLSLQLELGRAYLASGDGKTAITYLRKASAEPAGLSTIEVPQLDRITVALADTNDGLDIAEKLSEQALKRIDQESVSSATDSIPSDAPYVLAETWDAAGWLAFQSGKMERAENFAKAAWLLNETDEVGYHLGQIYEKEGKTKQAVHQYALAMAASDTAPLMMGQNIGRNEKKVYRQRALERYVKLTGKQPSLNASDRLPNGQWSVSPIEELSRMREVKIASNASVSGSAEFRLRFAPERLESVEFVSGESGLKPERDQVSKAHFPVVFPSGSHAEIVRRALLSCHPAEGCNIVFLPVSRGNHYSY